MKIFRFYRTVKHLRFSQVFYRLKYAVIRPTLTNGPSIIWKNVRPKVPSEFRIGRQDYDGRNVFTFNHRSITFEGDDWDVVRVDKLWLYVLHSHQWLLQENCDSSFWINKWIDENPPLSTVGWETYPLSLRIISWIKTFISKEMVPNHKILGSLSSQTGLLYSRLDFRTSANHLLHNLLALFLVSYFFEESGGTVRINGRIRRLLLRELDEQFLDDGGHYELSPMYHAILLQSILDIINIVDSAFSFEILKKLENIAVRGLDWLSYMSIGGNMALFGDSVRNGGPSAAELFGYGEELLGWKPPSPAKGYKYLKETGYVVMRTDRLSFIQDVGKIGPDHQPGHSHCDMLSFCLWVDGKELIVDSGNYEYLDTEMRSYCRSTAAHNTVMVNENEQAEIWASHRVGRRGYPLETEIVEDSTGVRIQSGHSAYAFLKGKPIIRRSIRVRDAEIRVEERVESERTYPCATFLHMSPSAEIQQTDDDLLVSSNNTRLTVSAKSKPIVTTGWYCSEFGKKEPTKVIRYDFQGTLSYTIRLDNDVTEELRYPEPQP